MIRRAVWLVSTMQDGREVFARLTDDGTVSWTGTVLDATRFGTQEIALAWGRARFEDFDVQQKGVH